MVSRSSTARDADVQVVAGPSTSRIRTPSKRLASTLPPASSPQSPRKRRTSVAHPQPVESVSERAETRTPLGQSASNRPTPSSSRATPTPRCNAAEDEVGSGRASVKRKRGNGTTVDDSLDKKKTGRGHDRSLSLAEVTMPARNAVPVDGTPVRAKGGHRRTASMAQEPSLGSSITQPLPTPSPRTQANGSAPRPSKRQKLSSPISARAAQTAKLNHKPPPDAVFGDTATGVAAELEAVDNEEDESGDNLGDDTYDLPTASQAVSRDTFLANEALRRQREARNFVWKGDENAPKLTRSGRVIVPRSVEADEAAADEYGPMVEEDGAVEDDAMDVDSPRAQSLEIAQADDAVAPTSKPSKGAEKEIDTSVVPLPAGARPHVVRILETLTSAGVSQQPAPFDDEEKNEALQGLLSLLRGTVERGEGNSGLITGARGVGKTRTVARALDLLSPAMGVAGVRRKDEPIVVRLSGHAQTNDRLAIREMGRQISEAEGRAVVESSEGDNVELDDEEFAPTTLPSHLLALLTQPSPRAIIIVIEEFDLFTEHARQALLYCLLDVVQSIKTGPVESTGRGVAVIGVTSRVDTLLLLEKRVKSRFSHRMWRVQSPLAAGGPGWHSLVKRALVPWLVSDKKTKPAEDEDEDEATENWKMDWEMALDLLLEHPKVARHMERMSGLTTDLRLLYRPFILPVTQVLRSSLEFITVFSLISSVLAQVDGASWTLSSLAPGAQSAQAASQYILASSKLRGLPQPCLGVLIIAKHLAYAGRDEWNFVQAEEEYLRFARTRLVGSGKVRWPVGVLRTAFDHLLRIGVLVPAGGGSVKPPFAKVRCTLSPHEIVAFFKGDGAAGLGPELTNWGRTMGGHA